MYHSNFRAKMIISNVFNIDYTSRWCIRNKLTVNAKKTKHMLVLRNKDLINTVEALSVNFAGAMLGNVPKYKYLGVDLDRNLTYENAVHNTYVKANKKLFIFLHILCPYVDVDIYHAIIKHT